MKISVSVSTPIGKYKDTKASIVNVKTVDGERGILAGHMPLVLSLVPGKMSLEEPDGRHNYKVGKGVLYFKENNCTVLVDHIEELGE